MVKRVAQFFDARDQSSRPPFAEIALLPFHISYYIIKVFVFNKNKGNNRKVYIKHRVGLGLSEQQVLCSDALFTLLCRRSAQQARVTSENTEWRFIFSLIY